MFARFHQRGWHYLLLLALGSTMFLLNLGGASLWDLDEGRNATAAYEMMQSGNWIVPTFNSELRVDKPALLYWLQIAAYRVFGVNEFAARLPSALASLGAVLLCYELGRSLFSKATGLIAGVMLATTPMLCGAARFANPDALLHLFTVLTLTLFWLGHATPTRGWYLALGVSVGFAVLAKGPVGLVLPGAVVGLFVLWQRRWDLVFRRELGWFVLAFLLVALPWYVWVAIDTKASFLRGFLMVHNVDRFLSPMENHRGSIFYYPIVLIVGLGPWSIFVGPTIWFGVWSAIRQPWQRLAPSWQRAVESPEGGETTAAYRLLWCWIAVYLAFFTVAATKLPNYVLPVVVPCSLLTARYLQRWRAGLIQVPTALMATSLACLLLIGVGVFAGLNVAGGTWPLAALRGRFFTGLETYAWFGLFPIVAAVVAGWALRRQSRSGVVVAVALGATLLLAPLAAYGSALFNRFKAPSTLTIIADAARLDRDLRIGCWRMEHLPSLNFYVQRDVTHHKTEDEIATFLRFPVPVMLFLPATEWERLRSTMPTTCRVVGQNLDLYRHAEVVVVTNR